MSVRDLERLARALIERRAELAATQEEFVRRAGNSPDGKPGLSLKQLQRIEGAKVSPRPKTLGALDRAAGWPAGTSHRVLDGGPPPAITDRQDRPPEPAVPQGEFERLEDDLVARLLRQGFSPERIDRALDALREANLGLSTVEPAVDEPAVPDRARSAGSVDRPSDTGTG